MNRLTVDQLFNVAPPNQILSIEGSQSTFVTKNYVFVFCPAAKLLLKFHLSNFKLESQYKIEDNIIALIQSKNLILFLVQKSQILHTLSASGQIQKYPSHMSSITTLISYGESIATASQDMTVRLWNQCQQKLIQNPVKHALLGHSNRINCLQVYGNLLISGSSDKSIVFWNKTQKWTDLKLQESIVSIQSCSQSNQLAVCDKNSEICIIDMKKVLSLKNAVIIHKISINYPHFGRQFLGQIDDSFILIAIKNTITFIQINLGKILNAFQLKEDEQITNIKCLGRIILYSSKSKALSMIKL